VIPNEFGQFLAVAIPEQKKSVVVITCELKKRLRRRRSLVQRLAHSKRNDLIITAMDDENRFASVISASLATLLAIEFGFSVVILLALGLYATAAAIVHD
jgi:hypothetical protein